MKRLTILILTLVIAMPFAMSQNRHPEKDTAVVDFGNTRILIIQNAKDSLDADCEIDDDDDEDDSPHETSFLLMDLGLNSFLYENKTKMPKSLEAFDVNLIRSRAFNMIFAQQAINFYKDRFWMIIGIGMDYNNYVFENQTRLYSFTDTIYGIIDTINTITKTKLATRYWVVPVGFHIKSQKNKKDKAFMLEAGVKFGYFSGAHTRMVYEPESGEHEETTDGKWHAEKFRYGPYIRFGYSKMKFWINYNVTPVFASGEGPKLIPFSAGITLIGF